MGEGGWKAQGPGCLPVLSPATEFQKRLETQHVRSFQHYRGDSYWQMKIEKQGPLNFFFSFEGIKDFGEKKRMKEPVHDSFTLLDDRKSERGKGGRMKN